MKRPAIQLGIVLGILFLTLFPNAAAQPFTYELHGLKFSTAAEFSVPAKAGLDALLMVCPKEATPEQEKLSLTAVLFTVETVRQMEMSDPDLQEYAKTTFVGVTTPGQPVERLIMGKKQIGDRAESSIPVPVVVETYLLRKKNGDQVFLAFRFPTGEAAASEPLLLQILTTLHE